MIRRERRLSDCKGDVVESLKGQAQRGDAAMRRRGGEVERWGRKAKARWVRAQLPARHSRACMTDGPTIATAAAGTPSASVNKALSDALLLCQLLRPPSRRRCQTLGTAT